MSQVQLKTYSGKLIYYDDGKLLDALNYATENAEVMRISFYDKTSNTDIRLIRYCKGNWENEPMDYVLLLDRMLRLNKTYNDLTEKEKKIHDNDLIKKWTMNELIQKFVNNDTK